MFSLDGKVAFGGSNIGKIARRFLKKSSNRRKIFSTSSSKIFYHFFITMSVPLGRIAGSIFRNKWKIKTVVFSKSIIGSHYEELGIIWLFWFHLAEKCVTLGQGFYSKFFCFPCVREKPVFPTTHVPTDKRNQFLLCGRAVFRCSHKRLQKRSFQLIKKSS